MDGKLEKIADPVELAQVQRQARQVLIKSVAAGAVLTLLVMLLPR